MQQVMDEERNNPLDEALSLLCSWNLKHLCDKFKEQEVCTVAFQYLTDADISELIPKIGPRTIFRSHLLAWRQNHELRKQEPMVVLANTPVNATTAAIKNEIPEMNLVEEAEENHFESISKEADLYEDSDSKTQSVITEPKHDNFVKESSAAPKKKLGVRAVLNNSPEGKSAIAHYNSNKCLDMHYRKKVVRIVIGAALEKRMDMSINDFQAMNEQLLEIFPNESEVGDLIAKINLYCLPYEYDTSVCLSEWQYAMLTTRLSRHYSDIKRNHNNKKFKVSRSAKKVMTTLFWTSKGILLIDQKDNGIYITGEYHTSILERLKVVIKVKRLKKFTKGVKMKSKRKLQDTFYVPRVGNTRARGMLYNKYINLSRNLRRNGLLEYKRQRTNTSR